MITRLTLTCLAIFALSLSGCTRSRVMESSLLRSGEIRIADYQTVAIADASGASFIELELESLFEEAGYRVVGDSEAQRLADRGQRVLTARFTENVAVNGFGQFLQGRLSVLLEDRATDRTLLTVSAESTASRRAAWNAVSKKLVQTLGGEVHE